jgi:AraC family transcriptional regulator, exoenzyme S synthesis regulatory protein ExsA
MLNIYDYITNSKYFKTFKVNDLLIVEYKCIIPGDHIPFWTHNNYFAYILSGETSYSSANSKLSVRQGDAMFVKKGTYLARPHGKGDYCAVIIFISDDFIQKVTDRLLATPNRSSTGRLSATYDTSIFSLAVDESLFSYFHSVLSYFRREVPPSEELLKVKAEELLLNILTGSRNQALAAYLRSIRECGKVSLRDVMETSFMYPMSLEEYARLCARSLSTFKSDFYETYKTTPGKWLIQARLQYARALIETTDESVNDIAFKSGFKNTAHFVKVFKEAFGVPPLQYRLKKAAA